MPGTVLVVEDDFDTLHPLSELLKLKNYAVITASDADEALSLARERHPDLIITDIVLPGASGLQLIAKVRTNRSIALTPIVVISGCGPETLREAAHAGANRCLEKPIDLDRLWDSLDQILGRTNRSPLQPKESAPTPLSPASHIDSLVQRLRSCQSGEERDTLIRELKQRILDLETKSRSNEMK